MKKAIGFIILISLFITPGILLGLSTWLISVAIAAIATALIVLAVYLITQ